MDKIQLAITDLDRSNAERFESIVLLIEGVLAVDTWLGRAELQLRDKDVIPAVMTVLSQHGFVVKEEQVAVQNGQDNRPQRVTKYVAIDGMTCRSCEITIERKFKKLSGVLKVNVNAVKGIAEIVCRDCVPDQKTLHDAISHHGYTVRGFTTPDAVMNMAEKPSFGRLVGLFALVLVLGSILKKIGLFSTATTIGATIGVGAAMILGLVAGSSSCMAVSGGLLLSSAGKFRERYGGGGFAARMKPVLMFVFGRVVSYAFLGGLIGLIGKAFTPSPLITGGLVVLAAIFMITMGLEMLKIAPTWLKELMPRMPKRLSHVIMDAEGKEHPVAPFLLGAGTFFLPCGFTQALQLYALTTGSFGQSALVLGGFALGTAPALLALGWASTSLKGKIGKLFFQFSGALVVVLGVINLQSGFTVAGYPISLPKFGSSIATVDTANASGLPPVVGGKQILKMDVGGSGGPYDPDELTVKAGVPVQWQINGVNVAGCISGLQSPKLGVRTFLRPGQNTVEFTAPSAGKYVFSCSMGMYRGVITAVQ